MQRSRPLEEKACCGIDKMLGTYISECLGKEKKSTPGRKFMVYNPQQKTCSRTHSKGHILVPSKPNILTEMMQPQKRILLTCSNMENLQQQAKYIESDEVSDDSMDDNSHMQQGRNFKVKEPKFVDSDVVSADAMGYHSDTQLGRELNNKQIEDSKRDGVSEDSICGSSLKQ